MTADVLSSELVDIRKTVTSLYISAARYRRRSQSDGGLAECEKLKLSLRID